MNKFLKVLLVVNIIALDAVVLVFIYRSLFLNTKGSDGSLSDSFPGITPQTEGCNNECQRKIYERIDLLSSVNNDEATVSITPTRTVIVPTPLISRSKTKSTTYVPIPGGGSILSSDWKEIPGTDFYLSKSDFQGLTGVFFEANFKLQNGNGAAYIRVFDKTHSIAPTGGEISTSSQTSTFVTSGPLYLWEGNNHYVIEARSSASDTVIFESGRLKIITEN